MPCTQMLVKMEPVKIWTWATGVFVPLATKWMQQAKLVLISMNVSKTSKSVMVVSVEILPEVIHVYAQLALFKARLPRCVKISTNVFRPHLHVSAVTVSIWPAVSGVSAIPREPF